MDAGQDALECWCFARTPSYTGAQSLNAVEFRFKERLTLRRAAEFLKFLGWELCGSPDPVDAARLAQTFLYPVEHGATVYRLIPNSPNRARLTSHNAGHVLREFACWCAERAFEYARPMDHSNEVDDLWRKAVTITRRYAHGSVTQIELRNALDAASQHHRAKGLVSYTHDSRRVPWATDAACAAGCSCPAEAAFRSAQGVLKGASCTARDRDAEYKFLASELDRRLRRLFNLPAQTIKEDC